MKKILAMILAMVMVFTLCACGKTEPDPNAGMYEAVYASINGVEVPLEEVLYGVLTMELKNRGKGTLTYGEGNTYEMQWGAQDGQFSGVAEDQSLTGTIADGIIVINNLFGDELDVTLIDKSRVDFEQLETDKQAEEYAKQEDWWRGLWYGWVVYDEATGAYESWKNRAYDVVCEINPDSLITSIVIWRHDASPDEAFAATIGHLEEGTGDIYKFVAENAVTSEDLYGAGNWVVDPSDSFVSEIDHMIEIRGQFGLKGEADDYYSYYIFLRPWGDSWDDLTETEPGVYPYSNMMPVNYEWYQEMVEQGLDPRETTETASMREAAREAAMRIVGYWETSGFTYYFAEDGTGSYSYGSGEMKFTYETNGDSIKIVFEGNETPLETTFSIEEDTLIIKDSFGVDVSYTRTEAPLVESEEFMENAMEVEEGVEDEEVVPGD